jgi:hypothetical protein
MNVNHSRQKIDEKMENRQRDHFRPTDNTPRSHDDETRIIMQGKADALIQNVVGTAEIGKVIQAGTFCENGLLCRLPKSLEIHFDGATYDHALFAYNARPVGDLITGSRRFIAPCNLYIPNPPPAPYAASRQRYFPNPYCTEPPSTGNAHLAVPLAAEAAFAEASLYTLSSKIGPFDTPESICVHFGSEPSPYGAFALPGQRMRPVSPPEQMTEMNVRDFVQFPRRYSDFTDADHMNDFLSCFIANRHYCHPGSPVVAVRDTTLFRPLFEDARCQFWSPVITFENERGDVIHSVLKGFDPATQTKWLIPCTRLVSSHGWHRFYHCVPHPGLQPLYNLGRLVEHPDDIVVLTDSVEVAALNQPGSGNAHVTWTSWLCDEGRYEQVDWSKLRGREHVYYLVTNHSGRSLDDAYLEADRVGRYLREEAELGIEVRFMQAYVDYPRNAPRYDRLADLIRHQSRGNPQVVQESVHVLEPKEFDEYVGRAKDRLGRPFHRQSDAPRVVEVGKANGIGQILLRPAIRQGSVTIFHARQKVGKSSFALSCARLSLRRTPSLRTGFGPSRRR